MEDQQKLQQSTVPEEGFKAVEQKQQGQPAEQVTKQQPQKKEIQDDHDQESKTLMPLAKHEGAKRYGNYIKIIDNSVLSITLGPDYLCFLPTFIFFSIIAYLLIKYIDNNVQSVYVIALTYIVCIGQCLSYLLVALSDPGIAHPMTQSEKRQLNRTSFCRKCRFDVPEKTLHCNYCDVCIIGYDHHCPWTSKCIGRNNLIRFYVFLFSTPIFIVYCAFAFGFTIDAATRTNTHLRTAGH